jgi:hypothetical protein
LHDHLEESNKISLPVAYSNRVVTAVEQVVRDTSPFDRENFS